MHDQSGRERAGYGFALNAPTVLVMNDGSPILDVSPNSTGAYLNAERKLLQEQRMVFRSTNFWNPQIDDEVADVMIDRGALHVSIEAKDSFCFLETLGFRCVREEPTLVSYELPPTRINVYHGRRSYEIAAEIESASTPNERYSFSEILQIIDPGRGTAYRNYAARTPEGVAEGLHRLACDVRLCVEAGILQDRQLFYRLKLQGDKLAWKRAIDSQLLQARRESGAAWAKKDFRRVVQALSPFEPHLDPSELKKLEYSKKHA